MYFHQGCTRDRRTRIYIPVRKIIENKDVQNAELLIENREIQHTIHHLQQSVIFPAGSSIILDFGQAIHGGIRFNLVHSTGKIRLKFGESVSETIGKSDQDFTRKDEELSLPHSGILEYGNTVFRFVKIENTGTINIHCQNVIAVALECDLEVTGSFVSSDERLNSIWKTAVRTVHLCMQDYIYDGAKRDRIVWMGDMHPEVRGILCAFSDHTIIRDSFEFLIRQTPVGQSMNNICTYSCWFIITLWDYYMASGDLEFLKKHASYLQTVLECYTGYISDNGSECVPERRFLDWPNNDNLNAKHAGIQALMLWMMQSGEKLLHEVGLDTSALIKSQKKLKSHIPDPESKKAPAALMTLTGLADKSDVLESDPFNDVSTFYGFYVLLAKKTLPALDLIRKYWGTMLDFGATSFWEDFDLQWTKNASAIDVMPVDGKDDIHADFGKYCYKGLRHSLSHGWSCGPAPFLSERVLGVYPLAPGCRKILVKPDLGDLEYVCGTYPVQDGVVKIEADASGKVNISAPAGIEIIQSQE
ncbi:MAG: alpha-L-rhamnosidase [Lentisphaeria bacterium]|nr:alpha-L-rhamnosidase [Lentisphaeria bacterium]